MGTLTTGNKGIFGDLHTNPGRRHCVRLLEDRTPITLDTHPTIMAGANEAPYRESGYRVLMEVPAQRDNTAEALQAYEPFGDGSGTTSVQRQAQAHRHWTRTCADRPSRIR